VVLVHASLDYAKRGGTQAHRAAAGHRTALRVPFFLLLWLRTPAGDILRAYTTGGHAIPRCLPHTAVLPATTSHTTPHLRYWRNVATFVVDVPLLRLRRRRYDVSTLNNDIVRQVNALLTSPNGCGGVSVACTTWAFSLRFLPGSDVFTTSATFHYTRLT